MKRFSKILTASLLLGSFETLWAGGVGDPGNIAYRCYTESHTKIIVVQTDYFMHSRALIYAPGEERKENNPSEVLAFLGSHTPITERYNEFPFGTKEPYNERLKLFLPAEEESNVESISASFDGETISCSGQGFYFYNSTKEKGECTQIDGDKMESDYLSFNLDSNSIIWNIFDRKTVRYNKTELPCEKNANPSFWPRRQIYGYWVDQSLRCGEFKIYTTLSREGHFIFPEIETATSNGEKKTSLFKCRVAN
jgi:hypothetical protein